MPPGSASASVDRHRQALAALLSEGRAHGAKSAASRHPGSRAGTSLIGEFAGLTETPYARAGGAAPRAHGPVLSGGGYHRGVRGSGLSSGAPDAGHRRTRTPLRDGP